MNQGNGTHSRREGIASRLAVETGLDADQLTQEYREQVDTVRDADLAVVSCKRKMTHLASRFGVRGERGGSHYDAERSALRAKIAETRRAEILPLDKDSLKAQTGSTSLSEAYLETYSKAHPEYQRYLERARVELEQYEEAQVRLSEAFANLAHEKRRLSEIEFRLQTFKTLSYSYGAEARLGG